MSDIENESDESLNTEDMQEFVEVKKTNEGESFISTGGVERSSAPNPKKDKVKKPKKSETENKSEIENIVIEEKPKVKVKKPRTEKQIEATKRLVEANKKKKKEKLKNLETSNVDTKKTKKVKPIKEEPLIEVEEKPKKKMGRPKTNFHTKEIIHKIQEKVIYMIPDGNGGFEQVKNPKPLTKKDLKKIELEKQAKNDEIEIGKKLIRKRNGSTDMRSKNTRTEKQLENARKLVEYNKKKKEDRLKLQQDQLNQTIKEQVTDSMIDVVTKPISEIKQERKLKRTIITPEEQAKYEFNKTKSLFC